MIVFKILVIPILAIGAIIWGITGVRAIMEAFSKETKKKDKVYLLWGGLGTILFIIALIWLCVKGW